MIDIEFLTLIITLLAGFSTTVAFLLDIKKQTVENSERITRIEARQERLEMKVEKEFAKCDMHCKLRRENDISIRNPEWN